MLNREEIKRLIVKKNLIQGYINLDKQLTPNGFDLTVGKIFKFISCGSLDFSNSERVIPQAKEVLPKKNKPKDKFAWWYLRRGAYKVRTNEIINLPNNLVAIGFCRTSLLRIGAFTQHGIWDAGFRGRSEFILVVENTQGIRLKENARIIQLIFFRIKETGGYQGIYQGL
jgi:dUTP pyrophosphatase